MSDDIMREDGLVTTARLQYQRNGFIDVSTIARLDAAGYIVDELLESFEGEDSNG